MKPHGPRPDTQTAGGTAAGTVSRGPADPPPGQAAQTAAHRAAAKRAAADPTGRRRPKPETMTMADPRRPVHESAKTCAICGKTLESGKSFYVTVRANLKEKYVCKACLKDRTDDKTDPIE